MISEFDKKIGKISSALCSLSTGERAELRRGYEPYPAAFWKVTESIDMHVYDEKKWYLVIQTMALLSGVAGGMPHSFKEAGIGKCLAANDYSENRLLRLLSAVEDNRDALLIRAVRFLCSNNITMLNCVQLAKFIFLRGDAQISIANDIARDYYISKKKNKKEN